MQVLTGYCQVNILVTVDLYCNKQGTQYVLTRGLTEYLLRTSEVTYRVFTKNISG